MSYVEAKALLEEGRSIAEVAEQLEVKYEHASYLARKWKKERGDSTMHHPEKASQVERLKPWLPQGPLTIYETCGELGTSGRPGHMYHEWAKLGSVVSRHTKDGDMFHLVREQVRNGLTYDVVDADVYSRAWQMLDEGLVRMVKPGGLLICSWPSSSRALLHRETHIRLYGHDSVATLVDFIKYQGAAVEAAGRTWLRGGPRPEKYGSLWRVPMVIQ